MEADGHTPQTVTESSEIGLRFHSDDEKYVAQCRINGFTLSRLTPYENWPSLAAEAIRLWEIYIQRLEPIRVTRLAARYINNLNLPLKSGESYQLYLHKLIDVPEEAPQAVEAFFQRFQLADTGSGDRIIITLTQELMPPEGPAPVILDLDAFSITDINTTDGEIWNNLERLRQLKNRCFFGTITERAAELYI